VQDRNTRARSLAGTILAPLLGRRALQPAFRALHQLALAAQGLGSGADYRTSGERRVLQRVSGRLDRCSWPRPVTILDVGASIGEYTLELAARFPPSVARVFAVEPARETCEILERELASRHLSHVQARRRALGREDIVAAPLHSDRHASALASLHPRECHDPALTQTVAVQTLDSFCRAQGIESIFFLKIDAEGSDLDVLKGAAGMLGARAIRHIQFEFGDVCLDSRVFFRDFFDLLHRDFLVYRVMRGGLEPVTAYRPELEVFLCTNYYCEARVDRSSGTP